MDDPYFLDFLFNNIIDVHFSGSVYVLENFTATSTVTGTATPPDITVTHSLFPGAEVVYKSEQTTTTSSPSVPTVVKKFFIWATGAGPLPTLSNYNTPLTSGGSAPFAYAAQFSMFNDINFTGMSPALWTPGDHTSGTYTTLAAATAAASAFDAAVLAHAGPQFIEWFDLSNAIVGGILYAGVSVIEIDVPSTTVASATTTLSGTYVVKIPADKASVAGINNYQVSVSSAGIGTMGLSGSIYSGQGAVKVPWELKGASDMSSSASQTLPGSFTVSTNVPWPVKHNTQITIFGGSGGGTGGGGGR